MLDRGCSTMLDGPASTAHPQEKIYRHADFWSYGLGSRSSTFSWIVKAHLGAYLSRMRLDLASYPKQKLQFFTK